jgi:hypothetical protein
LSINQKLSYIIQSQNAESILLTFWIILSYYPIIYIYIFTNGLICPKRKGLGKVLPRSLHSPSSKLIRDFRPSWPTHFLLPVLIRTASKSLIMRFLLIFSASPSKQRHHHLSKGNLMSGHSIIPLIPSFYDPTIKILKHRRPFENTSSALTFAPVPVSIVAIVVLI